ncbi:MAG: formylglycine-generating enzyme family protein [Verrucomicrobia bacterium]|nr:formylglycine-generating enzyme family protein [Verrucomicrobiota bacterium]
MKKLVLTTAVLAALAAISVSAADAKLESFTEEVKLAGGKSFKIDMVAIPGGKVTIGAAEGEKGRGKLDLEPAEVEVKPFYMSKTEVTWSQYEPWVWDSSLKVQLTKEVLKKENVDGICRPSSPYGTIARGLGDGRNYPALGMSPFSAEKYCEWLTKQTGKKFRLPTEEEWEYAARAGSTTPYFWGESADDAEEYAWFEDNSDFTTHLVGKKKPNAFGLYDMAGNVGEWVQFRTKDQQWGILRGGHWESTAEGLRSASRDEETAKWNDIDPNRPKSIWWLASANWTGIRLVCEGDAK